MSKLKKHIGLRIKEVRTKCGFKQAQLAEMVDIDSKHMSKVECGYSFPSLDLLEKLSNKLEIEASEFLKTEHLKSEEEIITEINRLLSKSDKEQLKTYYRIIRDITR